MTAIKPAFAFNRVLDPTMESGISATQVSQNNANYTPAFDTNIKHSSAQSFTLTRTAASPSNYVGWAWLTPPASAHPLRLNVTPGETIGLGVWERCSQAPHRMAVGFQWRDSAGAVVGAAANMSPNLAGQPANTWVWYSWAGLVVPSGVAYALVIVQTMLGAGSTSVGGEQAWYDDCIAYSGGAPPAYFDGNAPGCQWTGTPNQSQSAQPIPGPWARWDGASESQLNVAGQYDGAGLTFVDLRDVSLA